jgi:hypothetical protein
MTGEPFHFLMRTLHKRDSSSLKSILLLVVLACVVYHPHLLLTLR